MLPLGIEYSYYRTPWATIGIIAACVLVYFGQQAASDATLLFFMLQPDKIAPWQWVTSTFMHADLFHLGGNMLFLFVYGRYLEERLGYARYLGLYLALGVGASLVYWVTNLGKETPALGASGAISGLMGVVLVAAPMARVRVVWRFYSFHVPTFVLLGLWIVEQVWMAGIAVEGIAFSAHIGGFVLGAIAAAAMRSSALRHSGWHLDPARASYNDLATNREERMWESIADYHSGKSARAGRPDGRPTWDGDTDRVPKGRPKSR